MQYLKKTMHYVMPRRKKTTNLTPKWTIPGDNHYEGLPTLFNDEIVEPNEAPPLEEPIQIKPSEGDSEPEIPPTLAPETDGTGRRRRHPKVPRHLGDYVLY